jgi:hypothetical protein
MAHVDQLLSQTSAGLGIGSVSSGHDLAESPKPAAESLIVSHIWLLVPPAAGMYAFST